MRVQADELTRAASAATEMLLEADTVRDLLAAELVLLMIILVAFLGVGAKMLAKMHKDSLAQFRLSMDEVHQELRGLKNQMKETDKWIKRLLYRAIDYRRGSRLHDDDDSDSDLT